VSVHIFGTTLLLSWLAWSIFNRTHTKLFSAVCSGVFHSKSASVIVYRTKS